jgi:hypothetical protein
MAPMPTPAPAQQPEEPARVRVQLAVACCPEGAEISESASAVPAANGLGDVGVGTAEETPVGPEPQGEFASPHWGASQVPLLPLMIVLVMRLQLEA